MSIYTTIDGVKTRIYPPARGSEVVEEETAVADEAVAETPEEKEATPARGRQKKTTTQAEEADSEAGTPQE